MGYARNPNGTGDFVIQEPTFGFNNESLSVEDYVFGDTLKLYPNPTNGIFVLENSKHNIEYIAIYNIQGQLLFENSLQSTNRLEIDLTSYSKGVYVLNVNKSNVLKVIRN
ncbi:T9SS type A sorting domain-containing protein [Psychroserpens sp.]|uniref:T9SS type A sorting domain-containing protein n=1 Tax=Psychroserpens sp. TaxID=2020870 RepID=UPI00385D001F